MTQINRLIWSDKPTQGYRWSGTLTGYLELFNERKTWLNFSLFKAGWRSPRATKDYNGPNMIAHWHSPQCKGPGNKPQPQWRNDWRSNAIHRSQTARSYGEKEIGRHSVLQFATTWCQCGQYELFTPSSRALGFDTWIFRFLRLKPTRGWRNTRKWNEETCAASNKWI